MNAILDYRPSSNPSGKARKRDPLTAEQQALVISNTRLAYKASKMIRAPLGMSKEEWEAECLFALVLAAEGWEPERGSFPTCIFYMVKVVKNKWVKYREAKCRSVWQTQALGVSERLIGKRQAFDDNLRAADLRGFNARVIAELPERWRFIMEGWLAGKTYEEIGAERGVTRQAIEQAIKRATQMARGVALKLNVNPSCYRAD